MVDDPDVEALLNECDLSSFLKENAVKKVRDLKTDNVLWIRFVSASIRGLLDLTLATLKSSIF